MGTDCKSAAFSFGGSNPPAPTKKTSVENTLVFCFIRYLKFHPQGWIRTTAEPTAACGGNREARLGQRSAFSKPCQGAAEKAASATRKTRRTVRCNSDDRCQRQKQGGAVGAAASRMRVPPKARRSRWEPRPGFLFILRGSRYPPAPTKKPQRITLHSPFPVSSLPQGRLALQGNKKRRLAISREASLPLMLKV